MAKIPQYEQRQLASSVVGTPGVDRSGQILGNAAADTANTLAKVVKEQQQIKDDAMSAKASADYERKSFEILTRHQQERANFTGTLEERNKILEDELRPAYEEMLNSLPAGEVRNRFSKEGYQTMSRRLMQGYQSGYQDQQNYLVKSAQEIVDQNAMQAFNLGTNKANLDFGSQVVHLQEIAATGKANIQKMSGLTSESRIQLEKAAEEAPVRGFIEGALPLYPDKVLELLDSGQLDKVIDAKDKVKYREEAVKSFETLKQRIDLERAATNAKALPAIYEKYRNGDPSYIVDLNNMESPVAEKFRTRVFGSPIDTVMDATVRGKLEDQLEALHINADEKTAKVNYDQTLRFMTDVIDARIAGHITDKQESAYLMKAVPVFIDKVEKKAWGSYQNNWGAVKQTMKKYGTADQIKVMDRFTDILEEQTKSGTQVNAQVIQASLTQALGEYHKKKYPKSW